MRVKIKDGDTYVAKVDANGAITMTPKEAETVERLAEELKPKRKPQIGEVWKNRHGMFIVGKLTSLSFDGYARIAGVDGLNNPRVTEIEFIAKSIDAYYALSLCLNQRTILKRIERAISFGHPNEEIEKEIHLNEQAIKALSE